MFVYTSTKLKKCKKKGNKEQLWGKIGNFAKFLGTDKATIQFVCVFVVESTAVKILTACLLSRKFERLVFDIPKGSVSEIAT